MCPKITNVNQVKTIFLRNPTVIGGDQDFTYDLMRSAFDEEVYRTHSLNGNKFGQCRYDPAAIDYVYQQYRERIDAIAPNEEHLEKRMRRSRFQHYVTMFAKLEKTKYQNMLKRRATNNAQPRTT